MALFNRKTLESKGLNAEQIEYIMTESNRKLANDYLAKDEVQEKIDAAVLNAQKNAPLPNIKESEEYKTLQGDFDAYKRKIEASAELKNNGVKDKFLDNVYNLLDAEKPIAEQLAEIQQQYEEYFMPTETPAQQVPQFGADVKGPMPSGNKGTSFEDVWGFGKK